MSAAYIVCGPPSSGNRVLAAALVRSGCRGQGSTNQPRSTVAIPVDDGSPYVFIRHATLEPYVWKLRNLGYDPIYALLIIRDPVATIRSGIKVGHWTTPQGALDIRRELIRQNVLEAGHLGLILEILSYEGLTEPFLEAWLPMIGLPYVAGPLELPGQTASTSISNQNAKHYGGDP